MLKFKLDYKQNLSSGRILFIWRYVFNEIKGAAYSKIVENIMEFHLKCWKSKRHCRHRALRRSHPGIRNAKSLLKNRLLADLNVSVWFAETFLTHIFSSLWLECSTDASTGLRGGPKLQHQLFRWAKIFKYFVCLPLQACLYNSGGGGASPQASSIISFLHFFNLRFKWTAPNYLRLRSLKWAFKPFP